MTKNHHQQQQLQQANKNALCSRNYHTLTQKVKPNPNLTLNVKENKTTVYH